MSVVSEGIALPSRKANVMSNPLTTATAPVIPDLSGFGIKGKVAQRALTNTVAEFAEYLAIVKDYAEGDQLIDAKIGELETAEADTYAETMADLDSEDVSAETELAEKIAALESEYAEAAKLREQARIDAKAQLIATSPELQNLAVPTAEENAEAVQAIDLLRKNLRAQVATTITALGGKDRVGDLLDSVKLPDLGRGTSARKSGGGFKPRFQSVNIDGVAQAEPQAAKVAEALGITRDALFQSLLRTVSREDFEAANSGAAFNFTVEHNGVVKNVTVVKGVPAKAKTETETEDSES